MSETVRVRPSYTRGIAEVYHTDDDCPQWPASGRDVPLGALDDIRECCLCRDGPQVTSQGDYSYYRALKEAGEE